MMLPPVIWPLGTMMRLLSGVRMRVENTMISSTTPLVPPASTKSPVLKGWKNMSMTPLARLPSESCMAKPIARPLAASTAMKLLVSTPSLLMAEMKTMTIMPIRARLARKLASVLSTLALTRPPRTPRVTQPTKNRPMISVSSAPTTLGP